MRSGAFLDGERVAEGTDRETWVGTVLRLGPVALLAATSEVDPGVAGAPTHIDTGSTAEDRLSSHQQRCSVRHQSHSGALTAVRRGANPIAPGTREGMALSRGRVADLYGVATYRLGVVQTQR